ncbi:NG,NG-dimethylarginine dimethylaminohydrolase [Legionella busanensis]|uniref:NG,NG-dimethylarginine dimethylaminohydrolase n=1 Tax=Legionella busanensis TaxID=190655 RepID=A0A378JTH6_9GAMM|nr:arginine deiminase-related protein [Legionella busanensis]STX51482.1 NG,NG-dimethylarginine dimethylaminohydrolase [Legionella busanensis]
MYSQALVRSPTASMTQGLTSNQNPLPVSFDHALVQHQNYITALNSCGLEITTLPPLEHYPDACFVEDTALLTEKVAILTHPGALSRQGEVALIEPFIASFYQDRIEKIKAPGTVDAGDVLRVENHFYIGLSKRTNQHGADQLAAILTAFGFTSSTIELKEFLHLKSGVSYLGNNYLLVAGELINHPAWQSFNQIIVTAEETYAANSININNNIILPAGFKKTAQSLEELGFKTLTVDVSEFEKIDGGLSCLSLRF